MAVMMQTVAALRKVLGLAGFLAIFVVYWLYGFQHQALWLLLLPLVTMQRPGWNDTQHTIFTWVYGSIGVLTLLVYLLVVVLEVVVVTFTGGTLLKVNEFSLLCTAIFLTSSFVHLCFAIIERHDEPEDF